MRGLSLIILAATLLLVACSPEEDATQTSPAQQEAQPNTGTPLASRSPNIVLILADDLDGSVFGRSSLDSAWVPEGARFTNALATTSLCCPSRASILRGQYAHNTGLWNNDNAEWHGGEQFFRESGLEDETLATLLQERGYETWFGGKYLNGYDSTRVPPGWDHWRGYLSEGINEDGRVIPYQGHYTDWLAEEASRFVEGRNSTDRPFFMHVSTLDTHEPLVSPPRHAGAYPDARAPRPPSFSEDDVSDKPRWVRERRPMDPDATAVYDALQVERMRSALTLEDLSREVTSALSRAGRLGDTYLIFTSDNGYHMGLHGMRASKSTPYTEAHEVPFVVRGPGVPVNTSYDELVANTDIAPTALDLANAPIPQWMDGRSLSPFFDGTAPSSWRNSLLIEGAKSGSPKRPAYSGVRHPNEVYVKYASGEEEYYDLQEDPYQMENEPGNVPQSMVDDLSALEDCAGEGCRELETR